MIIEFIGKNYSPGEKLKDIVSRKIARLDKFFEDDTKVRVLCKASGESAKHDVDRHTMELTVFVDNGVLRAEVTSESMYDNIDLAIPKLEKQIIKHHKKLISKSKKTREKLLIDVIPVAEASKKVVRSKTYRLTPMTVEDAIEELELIGHSFFVFLNKATSKVCVLYLRNDSDYGLIEAEADK